MLTLPGPALYAAKANPQSPNRSYCCFKYLAPPRRFCSGFHGSTPNALAVEGKSCAKPIAPALETAFAFPPDSCFTREASRLGGIPTSFATLAYKGFRLYRYYRKYRHHLNRLIFANIHQRNLLLLALVFLLSYKHNQ